MNDDNHANSAQQGPAEQSLRLVIAQLTATLESTTDGILVTDLDKNVIHTNQRFKEMWNLSQEMIDAGSGSALKYLLAQVRDPATSMARFHSLYSKPAEESQAIIEFLDGRTVERYSLPLYVDGVTTGRVHSFRDITERARSQRMQAALYGISEAAHSTPDLVDLFRRIHGIIGELLPAKNFFVALYDDARDELSFPYWVDELDEAPSPRPLNSGTLSGEVVRSGQALLVTPDTKEQLGEIERALVGSDSLDWLGVPLVSDSKSIGALVVQSYSGGIRYTERDKNLLQFVSAQVASAVERKRAEQALRESEARHRLLADNAEDVIWTLDPEGKRTYISPSVSRMRGFTVAELMQEPVSQAFMPESALRFDDYVRAIRSGSAEPGLRTEVEQTCKDGSTVWVELTASRMTNPEGEFMGILGVSRDISERKLHADRIKQLAFYDALTSLPNRALFLDRLSHALGTAERSERQVALLFLDLDRFKEINDSLGHAIGDLALIEVARRLQATTRQEETLARLGGDEFVLVVEGADHEAAAMIAMRMLSLLVEPIDVAGNLLSVGGSIGIAMYPNDGDTADELIRHTDIAMYRAKGDGGGFCFYQPEMGVLLEKRIRMTARLGAALDAGQLQLHYQPLVSLLTGKLRGAEVLLRWHDDEYGWVGPSEFIPIAEERGMMGRLGDWVMTAACQRLRDWQQSGLEFPGRMAVNVSVKQLKDPDIARRLVSIVHDAGLEPEQFELEITESSMMADPDSGPAVLDTLSKAGFSLAIDDFGTGYSSLSYLKRFSVDQIKIDISFVRDMLVDKDDYAIVKAIIAMADSLGLKTTAEGVEHAAQADALAELGCHFVQGYNFGYPQSGEDFAEKWLRSPQVCAQ